MLTLKDAATLIGNAVIDGPAGAQLIRFTGVSIDSRAIQPGDLFVAIAGEHFDGHDYLAEAAAHGAVAALVSRAPTQQSTQNPAASGPALPCLRVADTRVALTALAAGWRKRFGIPVIAVTGSNGKTTTKEMIAAILAAAYGDNDRLATRGNLNNDLGVPLTLLRLRSHHRAAVIELGMNHPGETAALADITAPTVVLITNAQREHQEFMQSVEAVAREHGLAILALPASGVAVFPADDAHAGIWWNAAGERRVIDFAMRRADAVQFSPFLATVTVMQRAAQGLVGAAPDADVASPAAGAEFENRIDLHMPAAQLHLRLRAAGQHNARNAAAAAAAALAAGIGADAIARGLEAFEPVKGRMQRKQGAAGALLIDDTYNANPDSVRAAIDVLATTPVPRVLILGDMGEVGVDGPRFHAEIGAYAKARGIDVLLGLGEAMADAVAAFGPTGRHFAHIDALIEAAHGHAQRGALLVKGSRFMRMERVVAALEAPQAPISTMPDSTTLQGTH